MKYTYVFDESSGICAVTVTGEVKRPEESQILQQFAHDFGPEKGCSKYLFDMTRARPIGNTMDIYAAGSCVVDTDNRQKRYKTASVYAELTDDHRFLETVAVNRGYSMRVFGRDEMNQAIEWLGSDQKGPE